MFGLFGLGSARDNLGATVKGGGWGLKSLRVWGPQPSIGSGAEKICGAATPNFRFVNCECQMAQHVNSL